MAQTALNEPRFLLGLMCGTSGDGVAGAVIATEGYGPHRKLTVLASGLRPYPDDVREALFELFPPRRFSADELARVHRDVGHLLADVALALTEAARLRPTALTGVGVQAPTLVHVPPRDSVTGVHIEIGDAALVAERLGVPVVCDMRPSDMAVGGHGAPLSAFVDHSLFASPAASRAVQNIGGIANVTYLPAGCGLENVIAFDTGPGNMVIDGIVRLLTHGGASFDDGGAWAAKGSPAVQLMADLMRHPYIGQSIPKTSGREDFGDFFAEEVLRIAKSRDVADADLVATVTAFTAETIRHHYARDLKPLGGVDEMIVYGGGAHNHTLMRYIRERLPEVAIRFQDEFGIAGDARESVTWAVLADETLAGRAGNVPSASGAQRRVRLGRVIDLGLL